MTDIKGFSGIGSNSIKSFKTEKNAVEFAKQNKGNEAIVKDEKGNFNVHTLDNKVADSLKKGIRTSDFDPRVIDFVIDTDNKPGGAEKVVTAKRLNISDNITGYNPPKTHTLTTGVTYKEYHSSDNKQTIRAVVVAPSSLAKLNVHYSREGSLNFYQMAKKPEVLVVMNGTFFSGNSPAGRAAGDVVGVEHGKVPAKEAKQGQKLNTVTNAENKVKTNIENRYSFGITDNGKPVIWRGGLYNASDASHKGKDASQFQTALGGGVLLFDTNTTEGKKLYDSASLDDKRVFNGIYLKESVNDYGKPDVKGKEGITSKGQGGDPTREAPRSAVGIKPDGSMIIVNIGEGKDRYKEITSPVEVAKILKEMGCISAVMLDGGGAPVIIAKDSKGQKLAETTPFAGYEANKSMLVITK